MRSEPSFNPDDSGSWFNHPEYPSSKKTRSTNTSMSKLRENACSVPFRRWKVLLSTFETGARGPTVFPPSKTSGCTQIWHRRCDKDWLQEGGATPSPPLSLHLTQFSLPKCWPAYITWTNIMIYPIYPHFLPCPVCLFSLRTLLIFSFSSFFFLLVFLFLSLFLREYFCLLKLFECSCVLELLVGCDV